MLLKCPECQKDISSQANTCPHCGEPLQRTDAKAKKLIIWGTGLVLVGTALWYPIPWLGSTMFFVGLGVFIYGRILS